MRTPKDVGSLIRENRRKMHLDQQTLAERVPVSRQWLIAVERGKPGAELGLVLRTLDAVGVHLVVEDRSNEPEVLDTSKSGAPDIDSIVRRARKTRK